MAVCTLCQREATVRPKTAGWVCKVVYKALSDEISESFTTGHQVDSTVASADSVAAWHQAILALRRLFVLCGKRLKLPSLEVVVLADTIYRCFFTSLAPGNEGVSSHDR
jgi:hypothetical protein